MNWIKNKLLKSKEIASITKKQKQLGLLVVIFLFLVLLKSVYNLGFTFNSIQSFLMVGIIFLLLVLLIKPIVLKPFLIVWMLIGQILGEVSSFLVLGITYFVFLTPIVILNKLLERKRENKGWVDKQNKIDYTKLH